VPTIDGLASVQVIARVPGSSSVSLIDREVPELAVVYRRKLHAGCTIESCCGELGAAPPWLGSTTWETITSAISWTG
jgi:hypothetical protein